MTLRVRFAEAVQQKRSDLLVRLELVSNGALPWVAVLGAGAWSQPAVAGSDLWWHLASGREIWRTGAVPVVDPFSYTFVGRPWTNHEWLWDVLYWGLYRIHPELVAWFNLGLVFAILALTFAVARDASRSPLSAAAVTWLAAASAHWFLDIRPHLFTLLFTGLVLRFREHPRAPWAWPPLILLWVNLHGGFVFGIGMIGLWVVFRTLEPSLRAWRLVVPRLEWLALLGCFLAMLCNPWGVRILDYPLEYLDSDSPFRSIIEWQPPEFSLDPRRFEGRFWGLALLALAGLPRTARRIPYLAALVCVTFAMAATARRFIPLFAVTSAPVAAHALGWVEQRLLGSASPRRRTDSKALIVASGLLVALVLWRDVRIAPRLLDRWTEHWFYPRAALSYLQALDPPERLFNYYNWGGYMFLHAPGVRAFIDGRANTLYDEGIYLDYTRIQGAQAGYRTLLAGYGIELVFVPSTSPLVRALLSGPEPWKALYADRVAAILVPPGSTLAERAPPRPPLPDGDPELDLLRAQLLASAGRLDQATEALDAAIAKDPLIPFAYSELALIHARRGDLAGIHQVIERGIAAIPQERPRMREFEARAYEAAGALERSLESLREAVPRGPFSVPDAIEQRIRALEAALGSKERPEG